MRTYEEIKADAIQRPAFSNGFEWDNWSAAWCYRCKNEPTCPIINVMFIDQTTPIELVTRELLGLSDRYECIEFEAESAK